MSWNKSLVKGKRRCQLSVYLLVQSNWKNVLSFWVLIMCLFIAVKKKKNHKPLCLLHCSNSSVGRQDYENLQ